MIVITGATGNIGTEVVRLLSARGLDFTAISRNPPPGSHPAGVEWVEADLADRQALEAAFTGADRLFLLTGNVPDMVQLQKNAIAAAEHAGVAHVVKLSALGASDHSRSVIGAWHFNVERALRDSRLAWTMLRPHVFMQNVLTQSDSIRRDGTFRSPAGEAAIPMIDTRDIASVATVALTEPGHAAKRYTLTGPTPTSWREAVHILSEVLNRDIEYVPEPEGEAWNRLHAAGFPPWLIAAQLELARYQREGGGTGIVTETVETLTGRPPRSFREFATDLAREFEPAS